MTTATRSRIVYEVFCDGVNVLHADSRDGAELLRDAHAEVYGNDPLSDRYRIEPRLREEGD